jgi:hypothetical protein
VNDDVQPDPDMTFRMRNIASVLSLGLLVTLTSAQQPTDTQEPPAASEANIFTYGEVDKTCMSWTDGCRNCSRGSGPMPNCGNIGIACQPQDKVTCFGRALQSPKSEQTKPEETKQ